MWSPVYGKEMSVFVPEHIIMLVRSQEALLPQAQCLLLHCFARGQNWKIVSEPFLMQELVRRDAKSCQMEFEQRE